MEEPIVLKNILEAIEFGFSDVDKELAEIVRQFAELNSSINTLIATLQEQSQMEA